MQRFHVQDLRSMLSGKVGLGHVRLIGMPEPHPTHCFLEHDQSCPHHHPLFALCLTSQQRPSSFTKDGPYPSYKELSACPGGKTRTRSCHSYHIPSRGSWYISAPRWARLGPSGVLGSREYIRAMTSPLYPDLRLLLLDARPRWRARRYRSS